MKMADKKELRFSNLSLATSTGKTPYPPTINKKNLDGPKKTDHTTQESFLLLIENMRAGFQGQIDALKVEIGKGREQEPQPPFQTGAPIPNQGMYLDHPYPVFRAYPGAVHPNMQMMMANQNLPAHQLNHQNLLYPTLSS